MNPSDTQVLPYETVWGELEDTNTNTRTETRRLPRQEDS